MSAKRCEAFSINEVLEIVLCQYQLLKSILDVKCIGWLSQSFVYLPVSELLTFCHQTRFSPQDKYLRVLGINFPVNLLVITLLTCVSSRF